ncbi:MAG: response regulator [Proteobacteria bacterium]|nr:response regulator [Pseudomonadota bacterium]
MILILQSEEDEYELIEVASRLKRVFGDKLSILFLSLDYSLEGELSWIVDGFAQFPLSGDELLKKIEKISRAERRVLLIDDSKLIHKTVVQGLSDAGFQVFQAFDGQEGVEKAIEVKPDVIICDIEMPRMNGYEACSAIRRTADVADAHIIMSSTLSSAADQKKGFQVGVDEYVTKPVVIEDLVKLVERAFQNTAGGRENVLVLEKNTPFAKGLTKSLSQQGFSARISENIQKAVRSLKNTSCDLLIAESDPMDGTMVDLFNVIEDLPIEKRPDVIIMIPHQNQVDDRMARNSGAVGVLSKPFSHDAMLALVERALAERRSRKEREQLQRYVSKASLKMAVEKAVLGTNSSTTRADKKQAGVFFSDIANFTARCEKYEPKEIVTQINTLFDVITKVIIKNDGDIDKFIGDACMAFWMGEDTQSSQISVLQSILEIKDGIDVMNSQHDKLKDDPIKIRMGVNYGEVILCDLGASDARVDLTIISDSVNFAARLEFASK